MRTFKSLFEHKVSWGPLADIYAVECHVCAYTVRIFEKLETEGVCHDRLAHALEVDEQAISDLKTADYCDPELVIRLCRHLGLPSPAACPRRK